MKYINHIIILVSVLALACILPYLFNMATAKSFRSSFSYYSSVNNMFCTNTYTDGKYIHVSENGDIYNRQQTDSILPMLNYRQLLADSRMPDSLQNQAVDIKKIAINNFFFRYRPVNKNRPHIQLFPLFESMSGRVRLSMPGDVFRINSRIEFINPSTNTVKEDKSKAFTKRFIEEKFSFPAKKIWGNTSSRKAYDEGYFILDSEDKLFHLKMVKGKCFISNTGFKGNIEHLMPQEPGNREFYAFFFAKDNILKMISTDKYKVVNIPCPKADFDTDKLSIMGNMFFWNIKLSHQGIDSLYAIKNDTKEIVATLNINYNVKENKYYNYIFPFALYLEQGNTKYVKPIINFAVAGALIVNLLLASLFLLYTKMRKQKIYISDYIWILTCGIFGLISINIFKNH